VKLQFIVKHTLCLRLHTGQDTGPIASDLKTTVNDELKGEISGLNYFTDLQNRKHPRSLNSLFLNLKVNVKILFAKAMKLCGECKVGVHSFVTSALYVNEWPASLTDRITSQKNFRDSLNRNLCGSQDRSARLGVQKNLLLLSENETSFLVISIRSLTSALIIQPLPDRHICKRRLHLKSRNS
jgi:hypothetical protein